MDVKIGYDGNGNPFVDINAAEGSIKEVLEHAKEIIMDLSPGDDDNFDEELEETIFE